MCWQENCELCVVCVYHQLTRHGRFWRRRVTTSRPLVLWQSLSCEVLNECCNTVYGAAVQVPFALVYCIFSPSIFDWLYHISVTYWYCVTFAESEPYCHSILFVCLSGCLSVIPRPTVYHDWSITTKFGRQVYTCPRTRVSLFGSPISNTFGAREKNMQNFARFQRQPFNAYSCHCERDASCHIWLVVLCILLHRSA